MKIAGDASTRPDGDGDNWTIPPRLDRWCAQMPADAHFYYIGRSPAPRDRDNRGPAARARLRPASPRHRPRARRATLRPRVKASHAASSATRGAPTDNRCRRWQPAARCAARCADRAGSRDCSRDVRPRVPECGTGNERSLARWHLAARCAARYADRAESRDCSPSCQHHRHERHDAPTTAFRCRCHLASRCDASRAVRADR